MHRGSRSLLASALIALAAGSASATTREIAELEPVRFIFDRSVLNQLSYETYRDPFDELQTRPHNLLFVNIGRHSNLGPWQGQEGSYTRYVNALIGNNGAANVDNDADAMQGAMIRRETAALAWGVSAAYLAGSETSDDSNATATFSDTDDLSGFDLRGAVALQLSESRVLGAGLRVTQASSELAERSFETGVGGFRGSDRFDQLNLALDAGLRQFLDATSSWDVQAVLGFGSSEKDLFSEDLDDTGAVTDRFVVTNYDIQDLRLGVHAGFNRLRPQSLGESEYRVGLERRQRELGNSDLSYGQSAGITTPISTLLGQDTIAATELYASAKTIFQAGQTEVFAGARLGFRLDEGATRIDVSATEVNEAIDDSRTSLALTAGLRQPLLRDKLRFIVSGRADFASDDRKTAFDTGSSGDETSISSAQYAIGLEGVLANVTFDLAWLSGEEAPVVPVPLGLPGGSRRAVDLERLVFSAAVAW